MVAMLPRNGLVASCKAKKTIPRMMLALPIVPSWLCKDPAMILSCFHELKS